MRGLRIAFGCSLGINIVLAVVVGFLATGQPPTGHSIDRAAATQSNHPAAGAQPAPPTRLSANDPRCLGNVNAAWIFQGNPGDFRADVTIDVPIPGGIEPDVLMQNPFHVMLTRSGILSWSGLRAVTVTAYPSPSGNYTWTASIRSGQTHLQVPRSTLKNGAWMSLVGQHHETGSLIMNEYVPGCPGYGTDPNQQRTRSSF